MAHSERWTRGGRFFWRRCAGGCRRGGAARGGGWLVLMLSLFGPPVFGAGASVSALGYLERTADKGALYLPPSAVDPRFTMALYVNAAGAGSFAQRMWVLQRAGVGEPWALAVWDADYWAGRGLAADQTPPYSWPVSTGRKYRGDDRSGPTPLGVYAIDERPGRVKRGYYAPGMVHALFIDYHYSGGRRSGVAFHGTTPSRYALLGKIDSHGCIRMTQDNARTLLDRLQGEDGVLEPEMRWGSVPRFWQRERGGGRYGYRKDGQTYPADSAAAEALTKTGYRAITVIFKDSTVIQDDDA